MNIGFSFSIARSRPSIRPGDPLVPKPSISSDKDESFDSKEELPPLFSCLGDHGEKDSTSTAAPALPNSFENLHLLSD